MSSYSRRSAPRRNLPSYRPKRTNLSGYGAYRARPARPYRRRRKALGGHGAYYVHGGLYGSAKIGSFKAGGAVAAGYSHGTVNAPKLTGLGAYNVSSIRHNVLIKPDIPEVVNTVYAEGGTIVRHREYLGPIISSPTANAFRIQSFPLNPAQSITFPWLSTIASNYEEYKPNGLMFEFRSTASDAIASSTNLALGQLMMCTQYDPTDPQFASDVELLNYTWAQSGKVSDCVQHFVECDPKQSPLSHLYTREGASANDSDLRFSDFGRFSIATSGLQGTSVQIGQLWVTYEFILYKPKLGSASSEAGGWFHFSNNAGVANIQPAGTISSGVYDSENNLNITLVDNVNYVDINLPAAFQPTSYECVLSYYGGSAAGITGPTFGITTDPDVHFVEHANNNSITQISVPSTASTVSSCMAITWITVPGDGVSHVLKMASSNFLPVDPSMDLYITQIPYLDPNLY